MTGPRFLISGLCFSLTLASCNDYAPVTTCSLLVPPDLARLGNPVGEGSPELGADFEQCTWTVGESSFVLVVNPASRYAEIAAEVPNAVPVPGLGTQAIAFQPGQVAATDGIVMVRAHDYSLTTDHRQVLIDLVRKALLKARAIPHMASS